MRFHVSPEPLVEDDSTIAARMAGIPVSSLLATVAALTGDLSILRDELRPDLSQVLVPDDGYTAAQMELARELAAEALRAHRDRAIAEPVELSDTEYREIASFVAGEPLDDDHLRLFLEELSLPGTDPRAPTWSMDELAPDRCFSVVVIGAGMSGLAVAHRLRQAGVDVVIVEKNGDVGGTWLENDYPGCRVDIESTFYCYSFAQTPDWPQFNSTQPVLLDYFRTCADEFGLRPLVRFDTSVTEARWDDQTGQWSLALDTSEGHDTITADAVISAVGQLNRPKMPDIDGVDRFDGPSFHSARWDHTVDLADKRVGVIGTGASAVQFIGAIAAEVEHLTVHQRTPPWLLPVETYTADIPDNMRWLLRIAPDFTRWNRLRFLARTDTGLLPFAEVDPDWPTGGPSVGPTNEMARELLAAYYEVAFPDPELRAKVLPTYPPTSKRMVLDDGTYSTTLARDDVDLVTETIVDITERGVRTADGIEHDYDVLIFGTGFTASEFLTPMDVIGEGGVRLHDRWGGDARAHLGITVPEMPNLFLMYGPNTNIVINGSIIYFSECEATYITESIRMLVEADRQSMTCRPEVHDSYNTRIDAGNLQRAWGVADVNSWYRNAHGRVAQNWPFDLYQYWAQTRRPDPTDYVLR